jgi:hypothetical protein
MIVGFQNFCDALGRYKDEVLSSDGGVSILMMDGLLLIPVVMAAFFFPLIALELFLALVAVSVVGIVLMRMYHRGHLHRPHRHTKA